MSLGTTDNLASRSTTEDESHVAPGREPDGVASSAPGREPVGVAPGREPAVARSRFGVVQLGSVRLTSRDFSIACAWGLCLAYVWLAFGYGFTDPVDEGKGYLTLGVLVAKAVSFALATLFVFLDRFFDEFSSRRGAMACVGVLCAASSALTTTSLQGFGGEWTLWLLTALAAATATICCLASARACMRCEDTRHFIIDVHIAFVVMALAFYLVLALDGVPGAILFGLLPGAAGCLVSDVNGPVSDAQRRAHPWMYAKVESFGGAKLRSVLARFFVALFIFVVEIAFVRSMGLDFVGDRAGHEVGAFLTVGVVALLGVVMLALHVRGVRRMFMREYYVVAGAVICFAALVMVLTSLNNLFVRAAEGLAYFLLATSVLYVLAVSVRVHGVRGHVAMGTGLAVASAGVAVGWGLQNALALADSPSDAFTLWLLGLTCLTLLAFLVLFPGGLYGRFVGDTAVARGLGLDPHAAAAYGDAAVARATAADAGAADGMAPADVAAARAQEEAEAEAEIEAVAGAGESRATGSSDAQEVARGGEGMRAEAIVHAEGPVHAVGPAHAAGQTGQIADAAVERFEQEADVGVALGVFEDGAASQPTPVAGAKQSAPAAPVAPASEDAALAAPDSSAAPVAPAGEDAAPERDRRTRSRITFKEAAGRVAVEAALSKRETEVLLLVIKGWSDQRIADELYVSYNTVRAHIRHIYTKADVHNREELLDRISDVQRASGRRDS